MASPILGPITRVPYDVLTEIFVHCLPQGRLKHRQPDTTIAPILLCHVCSTWRTVALATPTLWSHLYYRLTVSVEQNSYELGNWILHKNQYAFLMWWKNNHRSVAPSLCLALDWEDWYEFDLYPESRKVTESEIELDGVQMVSLFEYISSAQHIETDLLFWFKIGEWVGLTGYCIRYPDPRTLIQSDFSCYFDKFYQHQLALIPNGSPSVLRHLYCSGEIRLHTFGIPKHWSSLTHIALLVSSMSLPYWYSLVRALPQLQMAHFRIRDLADNDNTEPIPFTLAQLSTLSISVNTMRNNSELKFPLGMLVSALHLPALRDLSLSSEEAWYDHHALNHIYTVLDCAPAVTTLTLGPFFLALDYDEGHQTRTLPLIKDVEPIWSRAPQLVHLRLVAGTRFNSRIQEECGNSRSALVRYIFNRNSHWLGLYDAACPIRCLTIIDDSKLRNIHEDYQDHLANYTRFCIREHAESSPDVKTVFEVILETQSQAIAGA